MSDQRIESNPGPLVRTLTERAEALAGMWASAVRERLASRGVRTSGNVTPREGAALVRWLLSGSASDGPVDLPAALAGSLGQWVVDRRADALLLEEGLIELRLLQSLLLDAVRDAVGRGSGDDETGEALTLSAGIVHRLSVATTLVAGMYNEEAEQERRRERRKLDAFTRMVSHEMRTPIGAAYTAARVLQDPSIELPEDERARLLDVVGRGLTRATALLESVTSLALARSHESDPSSVRALRAVVEDVLAEAAPRAAAAGVRLEVGGTVPAALVDGRRVELVLLNLLQNATRFADPSKSDRWVRIRVERDRDAFGWRIRVEDNGVGIGRDEQDKVFRRFYRAHTDLSEGSGLGLVVAREAAEQLGGDIDLESVPGLGSTFSFTVPDEEPPVGEDTGPGNDRATASGPV